tara:strand:- start:925 stop:1800 length:876 start_codon:yes stop_codon:yes gene_type:complete
MKQLKIFIDLTRLNKPIGFMLLFWPCSWGLAYAYNFDQNFNIFLIYILLFFFGSVLMRSAGCIVNDIVDRKIDKKVKRTKNRPLASGKISVTQSLVYTLILCLISFFILIQFNALTIFLGISSMFLAFSYPFMKRITYWPQLFLGLTFNWGVVMAWASVSNYLSIDIFLIYVAAIFWTLGYDTIYGAQDIVDDEIIGNKSTSIKFKKDIKLFVTICYSINAILLICLLHFKMELNLQNFLLFLIYLSSLIYQLIIFKKTSPSSCLKAFKLNNYSGLILFLIFLNLSLGVNL